MMEECEVEEKNQFPVIGAQHAQSENIFQSMIFFSFK
jgi:hypothetical protein